MSIAKMEALSPSMGTINTAVAAEESCFKKLQDIIDNGNFDKDVFMAFIKFNNSIAQMRVNQRSEVNIKTKMFKSVSHDPDELKMYIEASFPKFLNK